MRRFCHPSPGFGVLLAMLPAAVHGQVADTIYQQPKDYLQEWVRLLALGMALSAVVLIVWTLVVHRGRLAGFRSRLLLFVGVCGIPFPAMLMSSAVGLEQSKAVAFCESCHAMGAFVEDMKDPDSRSLAALHFRNRYIQEEHCYSCHTDYGLFGTLEAKVGGMSHVWSEFAGSAGGHIRPKTNYRFTICLNCHGQSSKFIRQKGHAGVVNRIVSGEATCTECHDQSHGGSAERRPS
jgi:nitrate/TMAO reductase-like tetraheme cytochrome c subunit